MKYALITGASKGIGRAIAIELAQKGFGILAVARSGDLLKDLCQEIESQFSVKAHNFSIDLSESDASKKVYDWVLGNNFEVQVLVNNAGYGVWGWFEKSNSDVFQNMMQLNMGTLTALTHYFIPHLKNQQKAYILNVSSTTAYQALATQTVYAASKSFVLSFTRGLRQELRKTHISVSCLSPGATDTAFNDRAGMRAMQDLIDKFAMQPDQVAKIGVRGMFRGKAEIVPGFINKLGVLMAWLMPKWVAERFAAGMYEKRL